MTLQAKQTIMVLLIGTGVGIIYFGGLWLTVKKLNHSRHPAILLISSYICRIILFLTLLYLVMNNWWAQTVAFLIGFLIMRKIALIHFRPKQSTILNTK